MKRRLLHLNQHIIHLPLHKLLEMTNVKILIELRKTSERES